jgi:geranylgeranyl transferase type-2 subunit beta
MVVMNHPPYLFRLASRLGNGLRDVPQERKQRHAEFLRSCRQADGGFAGRAGGSDLYYSSFAIRALALLDQLDAALLEQTASYVRSVSEPDRVVDTIGRLYISAVLLASGGPDLMNAGETAFADRFAAQLERFRACDGGYANEPAASVGSTYQTFLVALAYDLVGRTMPDADRVRRFVIGQRREDGGFVEFRPVKRGGTNPTAAAVATLTLLGAMEAHLAQGVEDFLCSVRHESGAFAANTRVPATDLLSTFTAVLTAQDLGLDELVDRAGLETFLARLEDRAGGFYAGDWDDQTDVEFTFYGLGLLGLLACA